MKRAEKDVRDYVFHILLSKPWLGAGLLVLVNLLFRLPETGTPSIWLDEAQTMYQVQRDIASILEDYVKQQQNAPLYFILVHVWVKLFGVSVFAVRLFSVLCMALAGGVLYVFARRLHSLGFALGVSLLFLGVNDFMFFAHEARGYACIGFEAVLSYFFFYQLLTRPKWTYALALGLANLALLYTHYLTVYLLLAQGVVTIYWWLLAKDRKSFKLYVLAHVGVVLLFLPWLSVVMSVMPEKGNFWIPESSWGQLQNVYYYLIKGRHRTYWVFGFLALSVLWWLWKGRTKAPEERLAYTMLFLWAFFPVLTNYFVGFKVPVFLAKYTFYASMGFLMFFAYSMMSMPLPRWVIALLFGCCIFYNFKSLHFYSAKEEDWKSAIEYVKEKHQPSETLVFAQRSYVYKAFYVYYDPIAFASTPNIPHHARSKQIFFGDSVSEMEKAIEEVQPKRVVYLRSHWIREPEGDPIENYLKGQGELVSQLEDPTKVEVFEYVLP
ncbi:MAG: glycosyltransferase family 39 protein [Bacteroidetes bacterium]|jgi:hypothetical protein|nr:glycosyltransferase family 39 protein [Bacteroidota bacterium]